MLDFYAVGAEFPSEITTQRSAHCLRNVIPNDLLLLTYAMRPAISAY